MITWLQVLEFSLQEHEAVRCTRALHAYLQSICCSAHTPVSVTTHMSTHLVAYWGNCRNKNTWMWKPELDGDWSFLVFRPHFEWSLTLRGACWSLAALSGPFVCVCGEEVKREALVLWKKALKSTSVWIPMSPLKGRGLIQAHEIYISILFQSGTCINRESFPSHNIRLALHSLHPVPQHMDALLETQSWASWPFLLVLVVFC